MANPFYISPPDPLAALMAGVQGYEGAQKRGKEADITAARQSIAQGGNPKDALQRLMAAGDIQGANLYANMLEHQASRGFRESEAQRAQRNADRSFGLQQQQFDIQRQDVAHRRALEPWQVGPDGNPIPKPGGSADPNYVRSISEAKKPEEKALPAELAARVAMAGKYLDEYPLIREKVAAGDVTGLNAPASWLNMGGAGEVTRKIKSGTDALLRNLTGAGMPDAEARKYVSRYEPQPHDKAETVLSKMDQLQDELRRVEEEAYRGRGGLPKNKSEARQVVKDAMDAIAQGAPRDAVMLELKKKYGISFGNF